MPGSSPISPAEPVGRRVVVADNDPAALELVVVDLGLEGHDIVDAVLDGTAALESCRRHRPDVAVLDHRMPPGPSGTDVAEVLTADPTLAIHVIVYTNYQDADIVARLRACGATYLPKGNLRRLRVAVADDVLRPSPRAGG